MFLVALFTIAKTWKEPKYPLTDESIKMWCVYTHTHTHIYNGCLAIKNNATFSNMDGPRDY